MDPDKVYTPGSKRGQAPFAGNEKGVRPHLPERPSSCFAQMGPDPFLNLGRNRTMTLAVQNKLRIAPQPPAMEPAFLVLDTESVPDGRLLASVKYPDDNLTP